MEYRQPKSRRKYRQTIVCAGIGRGRKEAMGLLQVGMNAASSVLADQWREYFYCNAMDSRTLAVKGMKRRQARARNNGTDNVITNGSIVAVNDGQCMIIVEQGKIVEVCAEPGEFVFDSAASPSLFAGGLRKGITDSFDTFVKRVSFGGDTGVDQRVYYFNTKEIIGNKYGTANPVPFRVVDNKIGLDVDISITCFGEYTYRIEDPILFYKNVCGNVSEAYTKDRIDSQLKSELLTALQPAFAEISEQGVRYSSVPAHADDLALALNRVLSDSWGKTYGIVISAFGVSSLKANEEDEKMIKELQRNAAFMDPTRAAAQLVGAQAAAMQSAAANEGAGAAMAFMGMNMAGQAGGSNAQTLFQMGQQMGAQQVQPQMQAQPQQTAPVQVAPAAAATVAGWTCSCGAVNKGKFCSECGSPKPAGVPQYKCDKCGWEPEDPTHPPKFCPECGDPFDAGDIK